MTYGCQPLESKVFKICPLPQNTWKRSSSLFLLFPEMHIIRYMLKSDKRHKVFAEAKRKRLFFFLLFYWGYCFDFLKSRVKAFIVCISHQGSVSRKFRNFSGALRVTNFLCIFKTMESTL